MSIVVKWGRERIPVPLPPPDTKLAFIRQALADYTQLPEHSFKLVHSGAVMKDNNAPISAYNIGANSVIAIIGGSDISTHTTAANRDSEHSTISQIRSELGIVRNTLSPSVGIFLQSIHPQHSLHLPTPAIDLEKEHIRLAELLLQSLLRLDAIQTEGEWEEARAERKVAVKEVQGLLDRLDEGWKARLHS